MRSFMCAHVYIYVLNFEKVQECVKYKPGCVLIVYVDKLKFFFISVV